MSNTDVAPVEPYHCLDLRFDLDRAIALLCAARRGERG
jgi:hypothetical protein